MRTTEQLVNYLRYEGRPTTDREMDISQVAGIITENYPASTQYDSNPPTVQEWAEEINDGDGWGYDCCYPSQQPYSQGWYTRVERMSLGDDELATAVAIAEATWADERERRERDVREAEATRQRREEAEAHREQARQAYWAGINKFGFDRPSETELMGLRRQAGL